jgi:hypothetical protein
MTVQRGSYQSLVQTLILQQQLSYVTCFGPQQPVFLQERNTFLGLGVEQLNGLLTKLLLLLAIQNFLEAS